MWETLKLALGDAYSDELKAVVESSIKEEVKLKIEQALAEQKAIHESEIDELITLKENTIAELAESHAEELETLKNDLTIQFGESLDACLQATVDTFINENKDLLATSSLTESALNSYNIFMAQLNKDINPENIQNNTGIELNELPQVYESVVKELDKAKRDLLVVESSANLTVLQKEKLTQSIEKIQDTSFEEFSERVVTLIESITGTPKTDQTGEVLTESKKKFKAALSTML